MEYLGYLDHTKNPDAIRKEFVDKFGEGSFIIQSEGENETVDMLEQGYTVDALTQRYNEIAQELKDEGYNAPLFDGNSDEYFETNEEFRAAYNQFLADRQGPEVEMYGVKLRTVESPHSEATKQFFKDYVQGNINEEVKSDFKNNIYDSIVNSTDNLSYVERIDDDYLNETLADAENPEAIKKVFYDNFEKGSLVAEIENDDPLSYSLNSRSDGVLRAYDEIQSEIQAEGNNPPLFDHESDEYFENNEDFKASYREFLLEKQGATKKIFGVNMAQIADPWGEETKNFFKNYINK